MQPISAILYSLYRDSPEHGPWIVACIQGAWKSLLGDRLSQVCRPVSWADNCLTVEILDQDWAESLKGMKKDLLLRLRAGSGDEIREISFR